MRRAPLRSAPAAFAAALSLLLAAGNAWSGGYEVRKVALEGDPAPGTGGGAYGSDFLPPALNGSGDVAFGAMLTGAAPISGVFLDSGGSDSAVALTGDAAPAPVGGTYTFFGGYPTLNSAGEVSFLAIVGGGTATRAIFLISGSGDSALIVPGDAAPGTGGGSYTGSIADLNFHSLSDAPAVAFRSDVTGGAIASGIFVDSGAAAAAAALAGDAAPGVPGATFSVFGTPSQNEVGGVAFVADLTGGAVAKGLFFDSSGSTLALALAGDSAPDTGGGTFADLAYPTVNDAGSVAFLSNVTGGAASGGIFLATGGSVRAVAVEGDVAPDTGGGIFASVASLGVLDASGRVAFSAVIGGGTVGAGVFLFDPASGQTSAVALAGETAPDAGGASFASFGMVSLNDAGQVAVQATLSDTSAGIFLASPAVASVPALPAPAAFALAPSLVAVTVLLFRRRRTPLLG